QIPIAKIWVDRAASNAAINDNPQVMRERQRYLTFTGNYQEAADLGYKVIEKLPNDPEAPDYLAYDLLYLNRFDDAYKIVQRFEPMRPNDRDLPLVAGYVEAHTGHPREADLAAASMPDSAAIHLARAEAYRQEMIFRKAEVEYRAALKIAPNDVQVHLALAEALYRLHRYHDSLDVLKSALGVNTPGVGTGV